jgi:hypothetical protein
MKLDQLWLLAMGDWSPLAKHDIVAVKEPSCSARVHIEDIHLSPALQTGRPS